MFKKMMLIVLFCIVIFNILNANGDEKQGEKNKLHTVKKVVERKLNYEEIQKEKKLTFEDMMVSETYIELPLFKKVFPGVEFFIESSCITLPPQKRIVGKLKGKKIGCLVE